MYEIYTKKKKKKEKKIENNKEARKFLNFIVLKNVTNRNWINIEIEFFYGFIA